MFGSRILKGKGVSTGLILITFVRPLFMMSGSEDRLGTHRTIWLTFVGCFAGLKYKHPLE
jgi:hypothetical protein